MMVAGNSRHVTEISIRRRISNIFNKREEDFATLKEYNDYLEEVEDMIFKLVAGEDAPLIEAKIEAYQRENVDLISTNQAIKAEQLAKAMQAYNGNPAQNKTDQDGSYQGGFSIDTEKYAPTVPGGQPRPTGNPQPVPLGVTSDMHGYLAEDEESMRIRADRGSKASGWSMEICQKRALEEAFSSIWI